MNGKRAFFCLLLLASILTTGFAHSTAVQGSVTISYSFSHLFRIASNQYAIWIEDANGVLVRTLFVTSFVSKKMGWKSRPQAVPTWTKVANITNLSPKDLDAVSGATPKSGTYSLVWHLLDSKGKLVPLGTYRYFVEGNIYWENRVLWSGSITIGGQAQASQAEPSYNPADAEKLGTLISKVSAVYTPGK